MLARYRDFFAAFEDFRGYVDFWLLQDMVTDDYSAVRFLTPFDDVKPPAIPRDLDTYREYRRRSIEFVEARTACLSLFARRDSEHRSPGPLLLSQRSGAITAAHSCQALPESRHTDPAAERVGVGSLSNVIQADEAEARAESDARNARVAGCAAAKPDVHAAAAAGVQWPCGAARRRNTCGATASANRAPVMNPNAW